MKSNNHPTYNKTVDAEKQLGNDIVYKNGRYYSIPFISKNDPRYLTIKEKDNTKIGMNTLILK